MRKGEAAALRWTDIDFKNKTINISKTLDFRAKNQNELFSDPKTFTSKRIITIEYSKRTVEIIHSTMSNAMEKAVLLGKIEKNPCVGIEIKTNKKREYNIEFINSDDLPLFLRTAYQYG
ncbi:hypothetical protein DT075_27615 [Bacillus licheniformis]|nr:hypothetical protein DT075_27615 [Bacillus licheniformis]